MSDREKEINGRLREAREMVGLTQAPCGMELGMERSTLVNLEPNRAPVRCDLPYDSPASSLSQSNGWPRRPRGQPLL